MLLLRRTPERDRPVGPAAVVVVHRPQAPSVLRRAAARAAAQGVVLHVVVASRRTPLPWALLGRPPGSPASAAAEARIRAIARGPSCVEVHPCSWRPAALAAGLARTLGGEVVG